MHIHNTAHTTHIHTIQHTNHVPRCAVACRPLAIFEDLRVLPPFQYLIATINKNKQQNTTHTTTSQQNHNNPTNTTQQYNPTITNVTQTTHLDGFGEIARCLSHIYHSHHVEGKEEGKCAHDTQYMHICSVVVSPWASPCKAYP